MAPISFGSTATLTFHGLPGSRITPHAVAFAEELERLKLPVERQIPLHGGQIKTQAEFLTVVQALRAGTMK